MDISMDTLWISRWTPYGYLDGHPMDISMDISMDIHMDMSMDTHMEMPIKSKVSKLDGSCT